MCTLIVATRVWKSTPLLVAANRDEKLTRASEPPSLREEGGMRVFAPKDVEAGGTWIGVNEKGLFVAVTNRFAPRRGDRRSRGQLVLDTLKEHSAADAVLKLNTLDPDAHNPFHLVLADGTDAHLVWSDGAEQRHEPLAPGVHVVTERSLGAAPTQRLALLHEQVQDIFGATPPEPEAWQAVMSTTAKEALEGICVLDEKRGYGTRSSTILYMGNTPSASKYLHSEGAPNKTKYDDRSADFRALFA